MARHSFDNAFAMLVVYTQKMQTHTVKQKWEDEAVRLVVEMERPVITVSNEGYTCHSFKEKGTF
jgi:hypothetical protein